VFEHVDDLKSQTGDGTGDEQTLLQRCSADDSLEHDGGGDCAAEREEKPGGRGGKWGLFNHASGNVFSLCSVWSAAAQHGQP